MEEIRDRFAIDHLKRGLRTLLDSPEYGNTISPEGYTALREAYDACRPDIPDGEYRGHLAVIAVKILTACKAYGASGHPNEARVIAEMANGAFRGGHPSS